MSDGGRRGVLRAASLHGQLGNQLFQLALVAGHRDAEGVPCVEAVHAPDTPLREALRPGSFRRLSLVEAARLRRPPSVAVEAVRRNVSGVARRAPTGACVGRILGRHVYAEQQMGRFDPDAQRVTGPVLYEGFFQHEGYLENDPGFVAGVLRPPSADAATVLRRWSAPGPARLAVVVRAAPDYVRAGWALPLGWYRRAVDEVTAMREVRLVVFSDVPVAAEAIAALLDPDDGAEAIVGLSPVDQLHLIAACEHAVVAASSFAWWGAWLGDQRHDHADRVVVAPDPWIAPGIATAPARWRALPADVPSGAA